MYKSFNFKTKKYINHDKVYEIVYLKDINYSNMKLIKCINDYGIEEERSIYYDKNKLYYKIWKKEYVHADHFKNIMDNNIYDNELILNFYGIIFDDDEICRGYITYKSESISRRLNLNKLPTLYNNLKKNIERTKYIKLDPVYKNIVKYNNKYCFIDLEEMYSFSDIKKKDNKLYMIFKTYNNIYPEIFPDYYSNYLIKKYFL